MAKTKPGRQERAANRLIVRIHASLQRRRAAVERWKQGGAIAAPELVVVVCRTCKRPIATTKVDQEKGEPPILLELRDEHSPERWECTDCGACRCCYAFLGVNEGDGATLCARCLSHVEQGEERCNAEHMSPMSKRRLELKMAVAGRPSERVLPPETDSR